MVRLAVELSNFRTIEHSGYRHNLFLLLTKLLRTKRNGQNKMQCAAAMRCIVILRSVVVGECSGQHRQRVREDDEADYNGDGNG